MYLMKLPGKAEAAMLRKIETDYGKTHFTECR